MTSRLVTRTALAFAYIAFTSIASRSQTAKTALRSSYRSVVTVLCYNAKGKLARTGSGAVICDDGYVITAYHVIAGCPIRFVRTYERKLIRVTGVLVYRKDYDLAILKTEAKGLFPIEYEFSPPDVGDRVYTLSSPLGLEQSGSEGIVAAVRRRDIFEPPLIQFTAGVSPGSSGGQLLDGRGWMIGLIQGTVKSGQGLNFAIGSGAILYTLHKAELLGRNGTDPWSSPSDLALQKAHSASGMEKLALLDRAIAHNPNSLNARFGR